jgi:hypothetical protein
MRRRTLLIAAFMVLSGGGIAPASALAAPTVNSFAPTAGARGTLVTVNGSGFTGATAVKFNGVTAPFSVVSATSLHASVPTLTGTGPISVTTSSGTGTSTSSFTVLPGIVLSRTAGPPTSALTISGGGFAHEEAVDIYEGATDVVVASTSPTGTFAGVPVSVPSSTPPGSLWFSVVGRRSGLAAQTSFAVRTDWLDLGDAAAGTHFNPFENVLNTGNARRLDVQWTTTHGEGFSNGSGGAIVAGGLAIAKVPRSGVIVALGSNGTQAWSQPLDGGFFADSSPAEGNGVVVAGATDGHLHAFSLTSGTPKWTTTGMDVVTSGASPIVSGSDIFSPTPSGIEDLNLSTGAVKWSFAGECTQSFSTPAVAAGAVFFTCLDSSGNIYLYAVGTDGTTRNFTLVAGNGATSAPAVANGRVYALFNGMLVSRSPALYGSTASWTVTPPFAISSDVAAGDGIVAACGSGGLFVVNASDGSTRFSDASAPCSAAPSIANGVIFVPANQAITMFDFFGDKLGVLGSDGSTGPLAVSDGTLTAVAAISGIERWALPAAATTARARRSGWHARPNMRRLRPNHRLRPYHRRT